MEEKGKQKEEEKSTAVSAAESNTVQNRLANSRGPLNEVVCGAMMLAYERSGCWVQVLIYFFIDRNMICTESSLHPKHFSDKGCRELTSILAIVLTLFRLSKDMPLMQSRLLDLHHSICLCQALRCNHYCDISPCTLIKFCLRIPQILFGDTELEAHSLEKVLFASHNSCQAF